MQKIHFRGVDTSNIPIGNTDIHIQIYYFDLIMISVSCRFCVFNSVTRWNKTKKYFSTVIISNMSRGKTCFTYIL